MRINKILYISTIRFVYPWNFINRRGKWFFIPLWLMKLEKVTGLYYIYNIIEYNIYIFQCLVIYSCDFTRHRENILISPPWLLQLKRFIGGLYKRIFYNVKIFIPVISQVTGVNTLCTSLWLVKLDKVTGIYKV